MNLPSGAMFMLSQAVHLTSLLLLEVFSDMSQWLMWSTGCRDMTLGGLYVLSLSKLSSELHQPPERCLPLPSDFLSLLLLRLLCLWWPW